MPFGLCQVHVQRAVRTKLTLHPKSEAARELLAVANGLCKASKKEFLARLNDFEKRHYQFINEKNLSENGRAFFVHKRLRSALNSLKRNVEFLFKFEEVLGLPKTTNLLEARFGDLKRATRNHSGLKRENLEKFVASYLALKSCEI